VRPCIRYNHTGDDSYEMDRYENSNEATSQPDVAKALHAQLQAFFSAPPAPTRRRRRRRRRPSPHVGSTDHCLIARIAGQHQRAVGEGSVDEDDVATQVADTSDMYDLLE
jgi:hypothetical protein